MYNTLDLLSYWVRYSRSISQSGLSSSKSLSIPAKMLMQVDNMAYASLDHSATDAADRHAKSDFLGVSGLSMIIELEH